MRALSILAFVALLGPAACRGGAPATFGGDAGGEGGDGGAGGEGGGGGEDAAFVDGDLGAALDAAMSPDLGPTTRPLPAVPFHTSSRWIVDAHGKRFKLASVNWYGADSSDFVAGGLDIADVHAIAALIRTLGFNSVRLPWSNQMVESNPVIAPARLAKNPSLVGKHALEVFDAVIDALADEGLVVILDNHRSRGDWCCDVAHGDGLWYAPGYPESSWLADWKTMAARYKSQPAVVGADLRNEPRTMLALNAPSSCTACSSTCPCLEPVWTGDNGPTDWMGAAQRGGNAVLSVNPNLLIIVEGLGYSLDFSGVYTKPLSLAVANRLVYSPHNYSFSHAAYSTYEDMKTDLGNRWGFILTQGKPFTAPVWVGEFGTGHSAATQVDDTTGQGFWFKNLRQYLTDADIDWAYWDFNGTMSSGYGRTLGGEEGYGIANKTWSGSALSELTSALQKIQPATQGP